MTPPVSQHQRIAKMTFAAVYPLYVNKVENELTQKARYMDKLVDELAHGTKMESILRS